MQRLYKVFSLLYKMDSIIFYYKLDDVNPRKVYVNNKAVFQLYDTRSQWINVHYEYLWPLTK